jgi:hypothetical protein
VSQYGEQRIWSSLDGVDDRFIARKHREHFEFRLLEIQSL